MEEYSRWRESTKANPLKIILLLTTDLTRTTIFRTLVLTSFSVHISVVLVHTVSMVRSFDYIDFIQQAPVYVVSFCGLILGTIYFWEEKDTNKLLDQLPAAPWLDRDDSLSRQIRFESKMASGYVVLSWLLSSFVFIFLVPSTSREKPHFFVAFLEEHFPHHQALCYIYYSTFGALGFALTVMPHNVLYIIMHLKFCIGFWNGHLEAVSGDDTHLALQDEEHQREVLEGLKEFVRNHTEHLRIINEVNQLAFWPLIAITLTGLAFFCFIILFMLMEGLNPIFCLIILELLMVMAICVSTGQMLRDESDRTFDIAAGLPWHSWNIENRKVLLVCLANMMKPMTLNVSDIVRAEYSFLTRFFKVLWSTSAVMKELLARKT